MPSSPTNPSAGPKRSGLVATFLALPNDSTLKTLGVALLLCLVCSVLISTAAVSLKPLQIANQELDRKKNILEATKLMQEGKTIDELFKQIEPKVVDLATGQYVESIDPNQYDQRKAAKDPAENVTIPPDRDIAQIRQRAKYATVYLYKEDDQVKYIVLPIHGYGLWSTLYGFLVLEGDANTIFGLQYYEHLETAGLGGEVDNPRWREKWHGKLVYDQGGNTRIQLVKGVVTGDDPNAQFHVDGLAGATLTANGVTNMMQYWLGEDGFGRYLQRFHNKT
ncbi:MAG: Na(+)-translocating NADH-quinone reductase subunit C [Nitrospirales bacterium]